MDPLRQQRELQALMDRTYGVGRIEQMRRDIDRLYGSGRIAEMNQQIDQLYGAGRLQKLQQQIDQAYGAGRIEEMQRQVNRLLGMGQVREAFASGPLRELRAEVASSDFDEATAQKVEKELTEFEVSVEEAAAEIGDLEESSEPFAWVSRLSRANQVRLLGAALALLGAILALVATPDQTPPETIALAIGALVALIEMLAIVIEEGSN
jgi:ABC-type Fe3+-siderophore transport system permease subunit